MVAKEQEKDFNSQKDNFNLEILYKKLPQKGSFLFCVEINHSNNRWVTRFLNRLKTFIGLFYHIFKMTKYLRIMFIKNSCKVHAVYKVNLISYAKAKQENQDLKL